MGFVQVIAPRADGIGGDVEEHAEDVGFGVKDVKHVPEPANATFPHKGMQRD
jgi:hypothetical protein